MEMEINARNHRREPKRRCSQVVRGRHPIGDNGTNHPKGNIPTGRIKAQIESAEYLAMRAGQYEVERNYTSFHEHEKESQQELQRLLEAGHLEEIGTWQQVLQRWPNAKATKLATLVKTKQDGTAKVRFIADMLRSGVNGITKAAERIVLPRGSDVVQDALELQEEWGSDVEFFTADVTDAFLNLGITEPERGHAIISTGQGRYAAYRGVPFGLATAPLLWGRAAAWIGRATQAIHSPWAYRGHIYVDDPVAIVTGTKETRTHSIAKTLTLWSALGGRVALHKADRGTEIKWIGAMFRVVPGGIAITIDKERTAKLLKVTQEGLTQQGLVYNVRSLAGELSWVAGLVPTIRPFVNMIWAASYSMEGQRNTATRKRPRDSVFTKMVRLPFLWINKFLRGHHGGITRTRYVQDQYATPKWTVRTDASTTGPGGILPNSRGQPVRYWASPIPEVALSHLEISAGEPGLMTVYELLALLISLIIRESQLRKCRLGLLAQLDNEAALRVAAKLASPHPKVNLLAAELALRLEILGVDAIIGQHWRNTLNLEADALSRLTEGKSIPTRLRALPRDQLPPGTLFLLVPDL